MTSPPRASFLCRLSWWARGGPARLGRRWARANAVPDADGLWIGRIAQIEALPGMRGPAYFFGSILGFFAGLSEGSGELGPLRGGATRFELWLFALTELLLFLVALLVIVPSPWVRAASGALLAVVLVTIFRPAPLLRRLQAWSES